MVAPQFNMQRWSFVLFRIVSHPTARYVLRFNLVCDSLQFFGSGLHRVRELKAKLADNPFQRCVQVVAVQVLNAIHNRDSVGTYSSSVREQVPTEALLCVFSEFERFMREQGLAIIVTVLAEHALQGSVVFGLYFHFLWLGLGLGAGWLFGFNKYNDALPKWVQC